MDDTAEAENSAGDRDFAQGDGRQRCYSFHQELFTSGVPELIPIIGARDYIEPRGFMLHDCPQCLRERVFSVYETLRKLSLEYVPTLNVRNQAVMAFTHFLGRWGIVDAD